MGADAPAQVASSPPMREGLVAGCTPFGCWAAVTTNRY